MATFDFEQLSVIWNGVPITDLDPDNGITIPEEDEWTTARGTHGSWVRSRTYGEVPVIEISVMPSSNGMDIWGDVLKADRATGRATGSLTIYNGSNGATYTSPVAFIANAPEETLVGEAGSVTWSIAVPNLRREFRGLPPI